MKPARHQPHEFLAPALSLALMLLANDVSAQENLVQLRSLDGVMSLDGVLTQFDDGTYVIDHDSFGVLRIDASDQIICIGDACPKARSEPTNRFIAGTPREMATLLSPLLEAYAASIGASVTVRAVNSDGLVPVILSDPSGARVADFLIATQSSEDAFASLANRRAAMIVTDRRMTNIDVAITGDADLRRTVREQKLAQDALVLVTSPSNPIRALSALEIEQIWSGAITNWLALGGLNQTISFGSALSTPQGRALFNSRILSSADTTLDAGPQFDSIAALVTATQTDTGTIGVMRRSDVADTGLKVIAIRETCGLLSESSEFAIKSDSYVLSQNIYSYFASEFATPELSGFAQWISTGAAESMITERNYVNAMPRRMALQDMGAALIHTAAVEPDFNGPQFAQVVVELRDADRTSIIFRFQEALATLDQASLFAIDELSQHISEGQFAGFEILLVGFSDSSGPNSGNTALALSRANAVRTALMTSLPSDVAASVQITPLSAGELMPMSCNTTADGRQRNRRVETWLRLVKR